MRVSSRKAKGIFVLKRSRAKQQNRMQHYADAFRQLEQQNKKGQK